MYEYINMSARARYVCIHVCAYLMSMKVTRHTHVRKLYTHAHTALLQITFHLSVMTFLFFFIAGRKYKKNSFC
jgi:hypothetical protein